MPEPEPPASPWYVRAMLGIAGWIGALFLLGFVGAAFSLLVDMPGAALVVGAALLRRRLRLVPDVRRQRLRRAVRPRRQPGRAGADDRRPERDPRRPAGRAALSRRRGDRGRARAASCPISSTACSPPAAPRSRRALAINAAALHGLSAPILCAGLALVWLEPKIWAGGGRLWRPVGYGLVLALLLVETFRLFGA